MTRPDGVRIVVPTNVSQFHAARWFNIEYDSAAVKWMADQFGWRISNSVGNEPNTLAIYGRNGKRYKVKPGEWVIALGTNGSIRVCSDKQYRQDYREASE